MLVAEVIFSFILIFLAFLFIFPIKTVTVKGLKGGDRESVIYM